MKIPEFNLQLRKRSQTQKNVSAASAKLVRLHASRYCWLVIASLHFLAFIAVLMSELLFSVQGLLIVVIALSVFYEWWQWRETPILRLQYRHDGWDLIVEKTPMSTHFMALPILLRRHKFWMEGNAYRITHWCYCSTLLIVVRIKNDEGVSRYMPIVCDSCDVDEFRWLRVVVKYLL